MFACFRFVTTLEELKPYLIYVKTVAGPLIVIKVKASDTIDTLKAKISGQETIPEDQVFLMFAGKKLEDGRTLKHYNIESQNTVSVVLLVVACFVML